MKPRILSILMACACANLAHADFNPVALTPESYTFDIVVEASSPPALPYCINVTAGNGTGLGDNTYYEQGLHDRIGTPGGNSGVPPHNTVFTSINNPKMQFLMPPDYTVNNDVMVDQNFSGFGPGTLLFSTPTTATNLAILDCGGGGAVTVNYTVTHQDNSTETGTLNLLDWFSGGGTVAWGANGRITSGGGYNNYNSSAVNNNAPYLYADQITVSGASPVTSITLTYASGQHGNFFAVSGNATGAWTPIPLDPSSFNSMAIVPAGFPLTATMDQGTNTVNNGNLATWFESGFVRNTGGGLPPSGSTFDSVTQGSHHYQMGDYTQNNAILIDTNHQTANIVPASPANYSTFAFLTAGGNVGGTPMTNICILQHADGVNETNVFLGYDWFDNNHNGSIAFKGNGRINMYNRTVNSVGNSYPYLFETYFALADTTSPVTNIVVQYKSAGSTSSTTYIMAISAASGAVAPVVNVGPLPPNQTVWPGTNITFTVGVSGTQPIGGYWQVENNGAYYNLTDGLDANGSVVSGSQTMTLTISNVFVADGTNYQFVATNSVGMDISPAGVLVVSPQVISISPAAPTFFTGNNIPLTVNLSGGPAVSLQWYYIDNSGLGVTNLIPGATNATYTIA
ncbi:MAG TPA: immunoglobulin domain-containing protein, partial [Verrucomicrobiae bacterium]